MTATTTKKDKMKAAAGAPRPYNRYNLFFILERECLILSKGGTTKWSHPPPIISPADRPRWTKGYEGLQLPPFPPRFAHLSVPEGWCVPGAEPKKRAHRKTHGVASFRDLARDIAASWKTIDPVTFEWCSAVEKILKSRHMKLKGQPAKRKERTSKASQSTKKKSAAAEKRKQAQTNAQVVRSNPAPLPLPHLSISQQLPNEIHSGEVTTASDAPQTLYRSVSSSGSESSPVDGSTQSQNVLVNASAAPEMPHLAIQPDFMAHVTTSFGLSDIGNNACHPSAPAIIKEMFQDFSDDGMSNFWDTNEQDKTFGQVGTATAVPSFTPLSTAQHQASQRRVSAPLIPTELQQQPPLRRVSLPQMMTHHNMQADQPSSAEFHVSSMKDGGDSNYLTEAFGSSFHDLADISNNDIQTMWETEW